MDPETTPDGIVPDDIVPDDIVPDDIVPDDKDWTWVLERPCPECGFDAGAFSVDTVSVLIRDNASAWQKVLDGASSALTVRARPDRWSTLEYAAHVRDVFRLYHQRLRLMLDTDDPLFANWDQDATAIAERYGEQDPVVVAGELVAAAEGLAAVFDAVTGDQWERPGRRSDGASFTVETFARYMIHDPVHHLWDVAQR
jgi:hypothetical protein